VRKIVQSNWFFAWMLLLPAAFVMIAIRLWPLVQGVGLSFTNRQLGAHVPYNFVGLDNFRALLTDTVYWDAMWFTVIYTFSTVIIAYFTGLIVALLMNMHMKYGRGVFRSLLMIPWIIPGVVAAYVWRFSLNDQVGIINVMLQTLGITSEPIPFLATAYWARISVIVTNAWGNYPFMALVLLAGLQNVSEEIKEAARIDGANAVQVFRYVVWPQLKGVTAMCTTLVFIWTFNSFDHIFLLTSGGPARATNVVSIHAYFTSFSRMNVGYAATMATTMLVFMLFVTVIYMRIIRGKDD